MKKIIFCLILLTCIIGYDIKTDAKVMTDEEIKEQESKAREELIKKCSSSWSENGWHLNKRENKITPERNNAERDGFLLYTSSLYEAFWCGAKDIEDVINNYLIDYMYYDEESGNYYHEAGKQRKVIWGQYTGLEKNDYSDRIYYYDHGQTESLSIDAKKKFNYCNMEQYLGDVEIYDVYIFVGWGWDYNREAYYKTNKGDYIYYQLHTPYGSIIAGDEYLMPADEYIDYCRRCHEKWVERCRNGGIKDGNLNSSTALGNDELDVFKIGSENFNLNASLKSTNNQSWVMVGIIFTIAIVVVLILIFICKRKKHT